ncbi:MAG: hypothetical protein Q9191_007384, partial [Dirinaria sp. TL-2023a]
VYMARSEEEVEKLADWVGFAYEVTQCHFRLDDGQRLKGKTFTFWWDADELENTS